MANVNTAHSRNYCAKTAREANQRRLDEGGMRISILLNADEAQRFTPLVSRAGGIKKAFLALLAQADMPETAPGTPSPEEAVSTDKEDIPR